MRSIFSFVIATILALSAQVAHAKAKPAPERGRPKILSGEAAAHADSKNVNFGETFVGGTSRTPAISEVTTGKREQDHDFVKIRLRWHPEMVRSAANID